MKNSPKIHIAWIKTLENRETSQTNIMMTCKQSWFKTRLVLFSEWKNQGYKTCHSLYNIVYF